MEEVDIKIVELSRGYRFKVGNHEDKMVHGDFYPNVVTCLLAGLGQIVHREKVIPVIKYELKDD